MELAPTRKSTHKPLKGLFMEMNVLSQAQLKELLHYCPDTGVFTHIKARSGIKTGAVAGCKRADGYVTVSVLGRPYRAHRLAWLYINGEFPGNDIDHINRVRSDNRFCNLRLATRAENLQNLSHRKDNRSGVVGVSWCNQKQKWLAQIWASRKCINLGFFSQKTDAESARKAAEKKFHTFQNMSIT